MFVIFSPAAEVTADGDLVSSVLFTREAEGSVGKEVDLYDVGEASGFPLLPPGPAAKDVVLDDG